jgi:hypothetical protein
MMRNQLRYELELRHRKLRHGLRYLFSTRLEQPRSFASQN